MGQQRFGRFIPTHVGNTTASIASPLLRSVHPHACGEHESASNSSTNSVGSSPRMWGTPRLRPCGCSRMRFIPTHVGNTGAHHRTLWRSTVHPHACGEHDLDRARVLERIRFIPTHVGNTSTRLGEGVRRPVHPHACGEHAVATSPNRSRSGSSPRMWGTRLHRDQHQVGGRFIPTHVGNTSRSAGDAGRPPVHPHACGEHTYDGRHIVAGVRFIPTHVGNTIFARSSGLHQTVHPHACGEHGIGALADSLNYGSSPRMWGTPSVPRTRAIR